jgi:hypothetical protein
MPVTLRVIVSVEFLDDAAQNNASDNEDESADGTEAKKRNAFSNYQTQHTRHAANKRPEYPSDYNDKSAHVFFGPFSDVRERTSLAGVTTYLSVILNNNNKLSITSNPF